MRILIHDHSGHPFQVQLSRSLSKRDYDVLHIYSASFQTPHGSLRKQDSDPESFECRGLSLSKPFKKYSFIQRRKQEIEYGNLLSRELEQFGPDACISSNSPLDIQSLLLKSCRKNGVKFIFWLQDVWSTAIYSILQKKYSFLGQIIGWHYIQLEKSLLRKSDEIVLITEDFLPLMIKWQMKRSKLHVIHNWAPIDEVPVLPKSNPWSKGHGFENKLCIVYSGTLGLKHNPQLLLHLSMHLKDNKDVCIVVLSEGLGKDFLKKKKQEQKLDNLILLGFQPFETLPSVLASADILVAVLEQDAGVFSVPSKVLTYHCAARPLLLTVPQENLAARIVLENNTGLVVSPNDKDDFVRAAKLLLSDKALRDKLGCNARMYAENTFEIETITDHFEKIIFARGEIQC